MPSVTSTAGVGEGPPNPVSFRDYLREEYTHSVNMLLAVFMFSTGTVYSF